MNIYQKLIEVRKAVPYLKKENTGHQYNYVSSSQVLATVRQKMDELGLLLIPKVIGSRVLTETVENTDKYGNLKKTTTYFTELDMVFTWVNADKPDETIECPWYGQGVDIAGEKGVGKAMTYAEKYFMLKFLNIATDKDDPDTFQQRHGDGDTGKADLPKGNTTPQQQPPSQGQISGLTPAQKKKINDLCGELGINEFDGVALITEKYGKDTCLKLTVKEASDFINYLIEQKKLKHAS